MNIFESIYRTVKRRERLEKQTERLVNEEFVPDTTTKTFTIREHVETNTINENPNDAGDSDSLRYGETYGGEPLIIVFFKKDGKWHPGLFNRTVGEHGRVVNRKQGIKKRVTTNDLERIREPQDANPKFAQAVQNLQQKYPKATFYQLKG